MTIDRVTLDHYLHECRRDDRVTIPAAYLAELVEGYRERQLFGASAETVAETWADSHGATRFRGGPIASPTKGTAM